jgi:hypothetical protein
MRSAVKDGRIDIRAAKGFLVKRGDVLEEFPELRARFEEAIEASDVSTLRTKRAEGLAKRLNDPKISRAAVFLKEPVEAAMKRVINSGNPEKTMREIVKQAGRDPTGDAVKGLKTAFGDFLLRKATTGHPTAKGEFVISGLVLKRIMGEGPVSRVAKELLSPEEQKRLQQIIDVAAKVEKAIHATVRPEGIIADKPSLLFTTVAGVAGAQAGRQIATATGGGTVQTPGILAGVFRRAITAGVQDPARRLLIEAVADKDLFAALLRGDVVPADQKAIRKQLNGWLISIGAEELRDGEEPSGAEGVSPHGGEPPGARPSGVEGVSPHGGEPSGAEPGEKTSQVTPALLDGIKKVESGGNPKAVSSAGAQGPYQWMPASARDPGFGVDPILDPFDEPTARRGTAQYMEAMLKRYDGDLKTALMAYNWGFKNVDKWLASGKKLAVPKETQEYPGKVLRAAAKATPAS